MTKQHYVILHEAGPTESIEPTGPTEPDKASIFGSLSFPNEGKDGRTVKNSVGMPILGGPERIYSLRGNYEPEANYSPKESRLVKESYSLKESRLPKERCLPDGSDLLGENLKQDESHGLPSNYLANEGYGEGFGENVVTHHITFTKGQTIAQAVYLSGVFAAPPLCSGMGTCGRCRIGVWRTTANDAPPLSPPGWLLGCQHEAQDGDIFLLPEDIRIIDEEFPVTVGNELACVGGVDWLAVDMGTTSVQWGAYTCAPEAQGERTRHSAGGLYIAGGSHDTDEQEITDTCGACTGPLDRVTRLTRVAQVAEGKFSNPQMGAGSDVVSRIQMASTTYGREILAGLSQKMLRSLVQQVSGAKSIVLAANPAMVAILLGQDATSLAYAPYALPDAGGDWTQVADLPPVWVAPHISPFVGGDISAGYAFLLKQNVEYPFLLADMGTNGEFILALSPDQAFATSVALGPALEGINLSHGSEAKEGVIVDFEVSPMALIPVWYKAEAGNLDSGAIKSVTPTQRQAGKMSGTAYIALLSHLIDGRAMNRQGQFLEGGGSFARLLRSTASVSSVQMDRTERQGQGDFTRGPYFPLPEQMKLYASDVEEIMKVKAAFSLGLSRLLAHAGLPFHALRQVYLAGALGRNVNTVALENLGFFPPGAHARITAVGNSALAGAVALAEDAALRTRLLDWVKRVRSVNLAEDPAFSQEFFRHMHFDANFEDNAELFTMLRRI